MCVCGGVFVCVWVKVSAFSDTQTLHIAGLTKVRMKGYPYTYEGVHGRLYV